MPEIDTYLSPHNPISIYSIPTNERSLDPHKTVPSCKQNIQTPFFFTRPRALPRASYSTNTKHSKWSRGGVTLQTSSISNFSNRSERNYPANILATRQTARAQHHIGHLALATEDILTLRLINDGHHQSLEDVGLRSWILQSGCISCKWPADFEAAARPEGAANAANVCRDDRTLSADRQTDVNVCASSQRVISLGVRHRWPKHRATVKHGLPMQQPSKRNTHWRKGRGKSMTHRRRAPSGHHRVTSGRHDGRSIRQDDRRRVRYRRSQLRKPISDQFRSVI